jgi:hypothetical protein
VTVVGKGEHCGNTDTAHADECAAPLLCDDSNHCAVLAARGEHCITGTTWGDTCAPRSVCDRNGTHTCIAATPVGQACTSVEACEALSCIDGLCREPLFLVTQSSCAM